MDAQQHRMHSGQYLTFFCGQEEYGVEILRVREIKGWPGVTRIPEAPSHVLGIINLRGEVIPVVDLRARLGLDHKPADAATVLIVVSANTGGGEKPVGLCVDRVSDVHGFNDESIKDAPDVGMGETTHMVSGLASRDASLVMLLDIDSAIGTDVSAAGWMH